MRMVHINDYQESTMELAKPVYDSKRRILLGVGSKVHPKYLEKLDEIGVKYLFVDDVKSKGISLDEMMDMPTWIDMISVVEQAFEAAAKDEFLPLLEIQKAVKKLNERTHRRLTVASFTY